LKLVLNILNLILIELIQKSYEIIFLNFFAMNFILLDFLKLWRGCHLKLCCDDLIILKKTSENKIKFHSQKGIAVIFGLTLSIFCHNWLTSKDFCILDCVYNLKYNFCTLKRWFYYITITTLLVRNFDFTELKCPFLLRRFLIRLKSVVCVWIIFRHFRA